MFKEKIKHIASYITNDGSYFYPSTPHDIRDLVKAIPHPEYHQTGRTAEICRVWHLVDCFNYICIPEYYEDHPDWKGEKLKRVKETCEQLKPQIMALDI